MIAYSAFQAGTVGQSLQGQEEPYSWYWLSSGQPLDLETSTCESPYAYVLAAHLRSCSLASHGSPLSALQLLPEVIVSLRGLRSPHCSWLLRWNAARKAGKAAGLPGAQHAQALSDLLLRCACLLPASGRLLRMLLLQLQPQRGHVPRGCWVGGLHWLWSWLWNACSASSL